MLKALSVPLIILTILQSFQFMCTTKTGVKTCQHRYHTPETNMPLNFPEVLDSGYDPELAVTLMQFHGHCACVSVHFFWANVYALC